MKLHPSSRALVVAGLALVLGVSGVAYGAVRATGQRVNIVDPVKSRRVANVDPSGSLWVKQTLNASFNRSVSTGNFYTNFLLTPILQTTATLAIDRVNFSVEDTGTSPWDGSIWYQAGDASSCSGAPIRLSVEAAAPGESHLDSFQQPLQLKPDAPGHEWCLKASFGPLDTSTDGTSYVDVSGSVVSGRLSPPVGQPPAGRSSSPTGE